MEGKEEEEEDDKTEVKSLQGTGHLLLNGTKQLIPIFILGFRINFLRTQEKSWNNLKDLLSLDCKFEQWGLRD